MILADFHCGNDAGQLGPSTTSLQERMLGQFVSKEHGIDVPFDSLPHEVSRCNALH